MRKKLLLVIAALFFLGSCEEESHHQSLIIGTSPDYPPFEFKRDGDIIGFDIDLARKIGSILNKRVQIVEIPFYKFVEALQDNIVDMVISSVTPSEERKKVIDFSNMYYNSDIAVLFKSSHVTIRALEDLKSLVVGVQKGSTTESFLLENVPSDFKLNILTRESMVDVIYDLKTETVDAVLLDLETAIEFRAQHKEFEHVKITEDDSYGFAIAFRKEDKLIERVNDVLEDLQDNQWLSRLKTKWTHINATQK